MASAGLSFVRARSTPYFKAYEMRKTNPTILSLCSRLASAISYSTAPPSAVEPSTSRKHPPHPRTRNKQSERDILLSVLNTTATKRDAKAYLSRFKSAKPPADPTSARLGKGLERVAAYTNSDTWRLDRSGVNLGTLYAKAIEESPVFLQQPVHEQLKAESRPEVHVAIVKIRAPQLLDDDILDGVGLTLSQLARLGMTSAVVIDCDEEPSSGGQQKFTALWRDEVIHEANRLMKAIQNHNDGRATIVTQAFTVSDVKHEIPSKIRLRGGVEVDQEHRLLAPMHNGVITIFPPIAYEKGILKARRVDADDLVLALTRQFAGLTERITEVQEPIKTTEELVGKSKETQKSTSVDRIILLDPLGGIPAPDRADKAHIFINLDQEYPEIREALNRVGRQESRSTLSRSRQPEISDFGASNPYSAFAASEIAPFSGSPSDTTKPLCNTTADFDVLQHIKNLDLAQQALILLPRESSALLTTPQEAASSAHAGRISGSTPDVRTRRQKNPLIYNLLTDKPTVSSSLPAGRLKGSTIVKGAEPPPLERLQPVTTFFKKGMPLTLIPDPRTHPWIPPGPEGTPLCLEKDPRIDLSRLAHLIEDSFGRKLDVRHYLDRIRNRVAGIIVAGEYEGGAILTWESPPARNEFSDASGFSSHRPLVPYLDKFAVLRASQGTGGVADVVFKAMVRTCFPDGVVWRSRQNNPVNKWYFERSTGTWRLPGGQWTMFWTGDGIEPPVGTEGTDSGSEKVERWKDYVGVCSAIEASWADGQSERPE